MLLAAINKGRIVLLLESFNENTVRNNLTIGRNQLRQSRAASRRVQRTKPLEAILLLSGINEGSRAAVRKIQQKIA